jgi:hypothetical protein
MFFSDIVGAILSDTGQPAGGPFETQVKIRVNNQYGMILDSGIIAHEERVFTLVSVANIAEYGLPLYVKKVVNIEDPTTPRFVYGTTARAFDQTFPGTSASSPPWFSFPLGVRGVEKYPATDGKLSIVSDSTADDGSDFNIRVQGFNTSGVLVTELKEADGTTSVTTTNNYDSTLGIERVAKVPSNGKVFTGNITISDDDANTIAVIPTMWESPDYQWIRFHPIPSSVITYNVRCEMRKAPLINDSDWPEFDQNYHQLLIWGVNKTLLPGLGKAATADRHRLAYDDMLKDFLGSQNASEHNIYIFADVQSKSGARERPFPPYILGVG